MLDDADPGVRAAAAAAAGNLQVRAAGNSLLKHAAADDDSGVRRASLEALRRLGEARVVPLAVTALADRGTQSVALDCIADLGGTDQTRALTELVQRSPSPDTVVRVTRMLTSWSTRADVPAPTRQMLERALAEVQGGGGLLLHWRILGPVASTDVDARTEPIAKPGAPLDNAAWRIFAAGTDARFASIRHQDACAWLAVADLRVNDAASVQFQLSGGGAVGFLNGKMLHEALPRPTTGIASTPRSKGENRLVVRVSAASDFQPVFAGRALWHESLMRAPSATRQRQPRAGPLPQRRKIALPRATGWATRATHQARTDWCRRPVRPPT